MNKKHKTIVADIGFGVVKLIANPPAYDGAKGIIYCDIMQPACSGSEEVSFPGAVTINGVESLTKLRTAIDEAIAYATAFVKEEPK